MAINKLIKIRLFIMERERIVVPISIGKVLKHRQTYMPGSLVIFKLSNKLKYHKRAI